jgi:hypothetical protein
MKSPRMEDTRGRHRVKTSILNKNDMLFITMRNRKRRTIADLDTCVCLFGPLARRLERRGQGMSTVLISLLYFRFPLFTF